MASSDLIVRVSMADVQKFIRDGDRVKGTTEGIGDAAERAGQRGSGGLNLMGRALTYLKRTAVTAGVTIGGLSALVVKNGLSYNAAFQSATTSFTTLLGSSAKAQQLMDQLREVSNGTPLRFTEVLDASKRMLGMGVSAGRTVSVLKGLNAAILATGGGSEQFDRASLALGQMQAKGKASAEELMQLAEAGVPVNKILQRELGMTAEEVANIGTSGIDSGRVLDAIARGWQRDFGQAAKNARNDWNNQTAQIIKDWEQFQRVITEPLFVRLNTSLMPRAMKTIRAATKGFSQGMESGGVMGGFDLMFRRMDIAAGAGGNLIKAWRGLVGFGRDLGKIISEGVAPAFGDIISATGGLLSPLGLTRRLLGFLADNASKLRPLIIGLVAGYVAWRTAVIASNAATVISNNLKFVAAVRSKGLTAATNMQTAATGRATLAQRILNAVMRLNPIGLVITALLAAGAAFVLLYKRSETFRGAVHWLWGKLQQGYDWVRSNWPLLLAILTGPFGLAVLAIARKWDSIKRGGARVKEWFGAVWSGIKSMLTGPFEGAWTYISGVLRRIKEAVSWIRGNLPGQHDAGESMERLGQVAPGYAPTSDRERPPGRAGGGRVGWAEPWTLVGERGPELVSLPAGSYVHTAAESAGMMRRDDGRPLVVQVQLDRRTIAEAVISELRAVQARA